MKRLLIIASLAALGGCATQQPAGYAPTAYAQPADPHQWHVVSVTPVNLPPGAPRPANYSSEPVRVQSAPSTISYSSVPVYGSTQVYGSAPVYGATPVYVPAPVYAPAPVFVEPYYPPFTFSLGFMFGHHTRVGGGVRWHPRPHSHR